MRFKTWAALYTGVFVVWALLIDVMMEVSVPPWLLLAVKLLPLAFALGAIAKVVHFLKQDPRGMP